MPPRNPPSQEEDPLGLYEHVGSKEAVKYAYKNFIDLSKLPDSPEEKTAIITKAVEDTLAWKNNKPKRAKTPKPPNADGNPQTMVTEAPRTLPVAEPADQDNGVVEPPRRRKLVNAKRSTITTRSNLTDYERAMIQKFGSRTLEGVMDEGNFAWVKAKTLVRDVYEFEKPSVIFGLIENEIQRLGSFNETVLRNPDISDDVKKAGIWLEKYLQGVAYKGHASRTLLNLSDTINEYDLENAYNKFRPDDPNFITNLKETTNRLNVDQAKKDELLKLISDYEGFNQSSNLFFPKPGTFPGEPENIPEYLASSKQLYGGFLSVYEPVFNPADIDDLKSRIDEYKPPEPQAPVLTDEMSAKQKKTLTDKYEKELKDYQKLVESTPKHLEIANDLASIIEPYYRGEKDPLEFTESGYAKLIERGGLLLQPLSLNEIGYISKDGTKVFRAPGAGDDLSLGEINEIAETVDKFLRGKGGVKAMNDWRNSIRNPSKPLKNPENLDKLPDYENDPNDPNNYELDSDEDPLEKVIASREEVAERISIFDNKMNYWLGKMSEVDEYMKNLNPVDKHYLQRYNRGVEVYNKYWDRWKNLSNERENFIDQHGQPDDMQLKEDIGSLVKEFVTQFKELGGDFGDLNEAFGEHGYQMIESGGSEAAGTAPDDSEAVKTINALRETLVRKGVLGAENQDDLVTMAETLIYSYDKAMENAQAANNQLETANNQVQNLNQRNQQLLNQIGALEGRVDDLQDTNKTLLRTNKTRLQANLSLQSRLRKGQVINPQLDVSGLKNQISRLKSQAFHLTDERDRLGNELTELQKQHVSLTKRYNDLQANGGFEIRGTFFNRQMVEQLAAGNGNSPSEELNKKIVDLEGQMRQKETLLADLNAHYQNEQSQMLAQLREKEFLWDAAVRSNEELVNQHRAERDQLTGQLEEKNRLLDETRARYDELSQLKERIERERNVNAESVARLNNEMGFLNQRMTLLVEERDGLLRRGAVDREELANMREHLDAVNEQLANADEANEQHAVNERFYNERIQALHDHYGGEIANIRDQMTAYRNAHEADKAALEARHQAAIARVNDDKARSEARLQEAINRLREQVARSRGKNREALTAQGDRFLGEAMEMVGAFTGRNTIIDVPGNTFLEKMKNLGRIFKRELRNLNNRHRIELRDVIQRETATREAMGLLQDDIEAVQNEMRRRVERQLLAKDEEITRLQNQIMARAEDEANADEAIRRRIDDLDTENEDLRTEVNGLRARLQQMEEDERQGADADRAIQQRIEQLDAFGEDMRVENADLRATLERKEDEYQELLNMYNQAIEVRRRAGEENGEEYSEGDSVRSLLSNQRDEIDALREHYEGRIAAMEQDHMDEVNNMIEERIRENETNRRNVDDLIGAYEYRLGEKDALIHELSAGPLAGKYEQYFADANSLVNRLSLLLRGEAMRDLPEVRKLLDIFMEDIRERLAAQRRLDEKALMLPVNVARAREEEAIRAENRAADAAIRDAARRENQAHEHDILDHRAQIRADQQNAERANVLEDRQLRAANAAAVRGMRNRFSARLITGLVGSNNPVAVTQGYTLLAEFAKGIADMPDEELNTPEMQELLNMYDNETIDRMVAAIATPQRGAVDDALSRRMSELENTTRSFINMMSQRTAHVGAAQAYHPPRRVFVGREGIPHQGNRYARGHRSPRRLPNRAANGRFIRGRSRAPARKAKK